MAREIGPKLRAQSPSMIQYNIIDDAMIYEFEETRIKNINNKICIHIRYYTQQNSQLEFTKSKRFFF